MSDHHTPDDPWSEVLGQVESALDDAGVVPRAERAALLDGVRSALDALVGVDTQPEPGPGVVVVEGGRRPEDPPTAGSTPTLRVAAVADAEVPPETDETDWLGRDVDLDWDDDWDATADSSSRVVVQVPGPGARRQVGLGDEGVFALEAGDPAHTIFLGPEPRAYRVACQSGAGQLGLDGGVSLALREGCSIDVEARQITFIATAEPGAAGRYVRLAGESE